VAKGVNDESVEDEAECCRGRGRDGIRVFGGCGVGPAGSDTSDQYDMQLFPGRGRPERRGARPGRDDHEIPLAQTKLQSFLASSTSQRQQTVDQFLTSRPQFMERAGTPEGQQDAAEIQQVAATCTSY
jgi:hemophore-related protein